MTNLDTTSIDEQIKNIVDGLAFELYELFEDWHNYDTEKELHIKRLYDKEIAKLISEQVAKELANLKISKLNLDKLTTDHADGYQMAVEDMNLNIDNRLATLNGVKNK